MTAARFMSARVPLPKPEWKQAADIENTIATSLDMVFPVLHNPTCVCVCACICTYIYIYSQHVRYHHIRQYAVSDIIPTL